MTYNLQQRVAQAEEQPVDPTAPKIGPPYPKAILQKLRRAFTVKGLPFFQFYQQMVTYRKTGYWDKEPEVPVDIQQQYRRAANRLAQVTSPIDKRSLSPVVVNQIAETRPEMNMYLGRLAQGREDPITWARINDTFVPLIQAIARDKNVYLKVIQRGRERWAMFRHMSAKQEHVEKMKDNDPEGYALIKRYGKSLEKIDEGIRRRIERRGLESRKGFLAGIPVIYGVDSHTGEERVYDRDGDVLTREEFVVKRRERAEAEARLAVVPKRTEIPLSEIRRLSEEEVETLPGDAEWASLTDDLAKQGRLTKIFPVKPKRVLVTDPEGNTRVEYQKVIVGGRYKGIYLDDMVNGQGRLIEGTAYSYSPSTARGKKVPKKIDPSQREPYITLADVKTTEVFRGETVTRKQKKLYVHIGGKNEFKEIRQALRALSCNAPPVPGMSKRGCLPSVVHVPAKGRADGFYFEPKDFGIIRDTLKGMSMSKAALQAIEDYYTDLSYAEQATAEENLTYYSARNLGGFVRDKKDRETGEMKPFDLNIAQKQALAWLDANGNNGVCALDTGVGKTLTSVAMMQKLVRDGIADPDASYSTPTGKAIRTNGRFLYVCPGTLRGNLPKEIRSFLSDPKDLLDLVDVISYRQFSGASRSKKVPVSIRRVPFWKGRSWDPQLYAAIFFDEAQRLKNLDTNASKAALSLWHPRKICLTASPMEKDPMEAFTLAAVTNNMPLKGGKDVPEEIAVEAQENQARLRKFKERFCETVGGRIIGVKQNPLIKQDLDTWVKRNIFYADKRNVRDRELPPLNAVPPIAIEMDPVVEQAYRAVTSQFSRLMRGLVVKFRDRGLGERGGEARDPELERVFGKAFKPIVRMLNDLANSPETALDDIATTLETGLLPYPTGEGEYPAIPPVMRRMVAEWRKQFEPGDLRERADMLGNPKLETADTIIQQKLERAEGASRTVLFSDDKRLCMKAVAHLSKTIPGKHVVALNDRLLIYSNGGPLTEVTFDIDRDVLEALIRNPAQRVRILKETGGVSRIPLPLRKLRYRRYLMLPAHMRLNTNYKADTWQQFAFKEVVNPDPGIKTCTLYGPSYQYGHNLQVFDTVIHLDRDDWNSENMKQRTARVWRQGQANPVDEITLDATYSASDGGEPREEFDRTLDEIRKYFQEMEGELFDRIIKDAQGVELGKEWAELVKRDSSLIQLDRKMFEMALSPYVGRSRTPGL